MQNVNVKNVDCHAALAMIEKQWGFPRRTLRALLEMTKSGQSGRSMIEMLGVLAIIGVLSVGGIAGYSKAMLRYKVNKSIEQVSLISQNVRSFFASQRNYAGLDSPEYQHDTTFELIRKAKLVPDEMFDDYHALEDTDLGLSTHFLFNAFGGGVVLWNDAAGASVEDCDGDSNCLESIKYFQINFFRLPSEACIELATQDWRSSAMGLMGMAVYNSETVDAQGLSVNGCGNGHISEVATTACPNGATVPIPVPLDIAVNACNCPNNDCTIVWWFK